MLIKTIILYVFLCICSRGNTQSPSENTPVYSLTFSESFRSILHDMENHFENVSGKLYPLRNEKERCFEAGLCLPGMINYSNQPDIFVAETYCKYRAEYGPYFSSRDVDKKKKELLFEVQQITAEKWRREEIKGGMKFTEIADPTKSIAVYHYYGDGNGIFVKVLFMVKK